MMNFSIGSRPAKRPDARSILRHASWAAYDADPYGARPDLPEEMKQVGTNRFVRSPESRGWVWEGDLPHASGHAMYERIHREARRIGADAGHAEDVRPERGCGSLRRLRGTAEANQGVDRKEKRFDPAWKTFEFSRLARAPRPRIKGRKKGGSKEIVGLRRDTTAFSEIRPPIEGKKAIRSHPEGYEIIPLSGCLARRSNTKRATGSKEMAVGFAVFSRRPSAPQGPAARRWLIVPRLFVGRVRRSVSDFRPLPHRPPWDANRRPRPRSSKTRSSRSTPCCREPASDRGTRS
jgi:hypothetical protein